VSDLKRYDLHDRGFDDVTMRHCERGNWVLFDDAIKALSDKSKIMLSTATAIEEYCFNCLSECDIGKEQCSLRKLAYNLREALK
jgi:hypothetical protein